MSRVKLSMTPTTGGRLLLRAEGGLDPEANYLLESSSNLTAFGNPATFSGAQLMGGGVTVTRNAARQFFRVRQP